MDGAHNLKYEVKLRVRHGMWVTDEVRRRSSTGISNVEKNGTSTNVHVLVGLQYVEYWKCSLVIR
jgi:hypothetical protein